MGKVGVCEQKRQQTKLRKKEKRKGKERKSWVRRIV